MQAECSALMLGRFRPSVRPALVVAVLSTTAFASLCAGCQMAGCESAAPAATVRASPAAGPSPSEWTGTRVPVAVASAVDPSVGPAGARGAWVLHIGDSFVHASFQQSLRPHFRSAGSEYVVQATTATYTTTWASDPELDLWLARRPSLVLVTLGANEVEMPVPGEHARAVESITRKIADIGASCVWITPPMWKKDTGILQVIHDHSAPCLFFDSDAVAGELSAGERQRDHIHPNERGGARWAQAFWSWLVDHRDPEKGPWALVPFERRGP